MDYRQLQILKWMVVIITPVGFLGIFSRTILSNSPITNYTLFYLSLQILAILSFSVGYIITRLGYDEIARTSVILSLELILIVSSLFAEDESAILRSFYYFILPIFLGSILTTKKFSFILTVINILYLSIYEFIHDGITQTEIIGPLTFVVIMSPMILVISYYRDLMEADRLKFMRLYTQHEFDVSRLETLGKHVGGIVHDFNNMLTVIQGNVEIMLAIINEDENTKSSETLNAILNKIHQIQKAITSTSELNLEILKDTELLMSSIAAEEKKWITSSNDTDVLASRANILEYLDDVRKYLAKFEPTM